MKKLIVSLAAASAAVLAFGTPVFDNGVLTYTVAAGDTAAGGIEGSVAGLDGFEETERPQLWQVAKVGDTLRLVYLSGTQILLR